MSASVARMADIAVLAALLENESGMSNLVANYSAEQLSIAAGFVHGSIRGKQPCWTIQEDEVLQRNLHLMPMEELSRMLGRSKTAIGLRRRKLGMPSISSKSGLPAHIAGRMLGFDSGKEISRLVRAASLELPAGGVKTEGGEVLVRLADRRTKGHDFADIVIKSSHAGALASAGREEHGKHDEQPGCVRAVASRG